ncbi:MAG: peptidase M14 [Polyangiaceae bacterium]|nr:peptidase M14 [Polyangiaceae bacterium]
MSLAAGCGWISCVEPTDAPSPYKADIAEDGNDESPPQKEPQQVSKTDLLLVKVHYQNDETLARLVERIDVLEHADRKAHTVDALIETDVYQSLLAEGFQVDVDEEQSELLRLAPYMTISGYSCYRTVEETIASMNALAAAHPNLVNVVDIGDSYDKVKAGGNPGYDMLGMVITNESISGTKPRFFLMGGFHAREYPGPELAMRFAEQVVAGYGTDAEATWLLDNFELHVFPQTNPDGRKIAEQGYLHRKNNNRSKGKCSDPSTQTNHYGIDLNRNHSFKYGGAGTSTQACNQFYRGPSAASEPETAAIQNYLSAIFPDQRGPLDTDPAPADATGVMLSLHSYGPQVLTPWAWSSSAPPNNAALQTLGRKFGYHNGYEVCQFNNCLYAATGTTDDWAYGQLGVASYTWEMGTQFFETCSAFESTLLPGAMPALWAAFKAARRPYQNPAGPDTVSLALSASSVSAGTVVTVTANVDDTRYNSNGWGSEPTQPIAAARYTLNVPSWSAGATTFALAAADGTFDTSVESVTGQIDTAGWSAGRYLILVEGADTAGNWGSPTGIFLDVN